MFVLDVLFSSLYVYSFVTVCYSCFLTVSVGILFFAVVVVEALDVSRNVCVCAVMLCELV